MSQKIVSKNGLAILIALQVVTLLTLWGAGPSTTPARADGIPDAGAQRFEIIQQLKGTNERLDRLLALLSGGELQVTVHKPDEPRPQR